MTADSLGSPAREGVQNKLDNNGQYLFRQMADEPYQVVDLFSGVGGLSFGLEQPTRLNGLGNLGYSDIHGDDRFETILAVEEHQYAAEGFENNFDSAEVLNREIQSINDFSQWGEADVVVGGPPCQGFSNLNSTKTQDLNDDRNGLWREFLRGVADMDPLVFLVENVPRFLNTDEAASLADKGRELGYDIVAGKVEAQKFGVPQKRSRAFIIGSKIGDPFLPGPSASYIRTVRDAIGDLPREPTGENYHVGRNVTELTERRMQSVPPGGNRLDLPSSLLPDCWKNYPDNQGTDLYGRLDWDETSVTIRADFVKPEKGRYLHPEANRSITMREGARLQTFPDDFQFGSEYKKHVTSQIGNAVPPKLAYHIGAAIHAHLEGKSIAPTDSESVGKCGIDRAPTVDWENVVPATVK